MQLGCTTQTTSHQNLTTKKVEVSGSIRCAGVTVVYMTKERVGNICKECHVDRENRHIVSRLDFLMFLCLLV
jgi:hypothetical protein